MDPILIRKWLPALGRNPRATLRLFCLPHAGGGVSAYHLWIAALAPAIEVCAIQLPGRESRIGEPCFRDMSALTAALCPIIAAAADRPFAIFGHSMGALAAFELACALAPRTLPVHLFVSGHPAPHLKRTERPLQNVGDDEFLAEIERRYDTLPAQVKSDSELVRLILPALRGDFALVENYVHHPRDPLPCPISVFSGAADASAPKEKVETWRAHTRGNFKLRVLPGGHFFVQSARDEILRALVADLGDL